RAVDVDAVTCPDPHGESGGDRVDLDAPTLVNSDCPRARHRHDPGGAERSSLRVGAEDVEPRVVQPPVAPHADRAAADAPLTGGQVAAVEERRARVGDRHTRAEEALALDDLSRGREPKVTVPREAPTQRGRPEPGGGRHAD